MKIRTAWLFTDSLATKTTSPSGLSRIFTVLEFCNGKGNCWRTDLTKDWKRSTTFKLEEGGFFSGDGKALCSTVSDAHGSSQNYQAVVSLFSHEKGIVHKLGDYRNAQEGKGKCRLVEALVSELKTTGVLISLDALHKKKTVEAILDSGSHCLMQVKRNPPSLFAQMSELLLDKPMDIFEESERGHGRRSHWTVSVHDASESPKEGSLDSCTCTNRNWTQPQDN